MDLRTEAAARALALACGALSLEQVIDWADTEISRTEDLDAGLIDVSLAKTSAEALSALNGFGPAPDKSVVAARAFQIFHRALVSGEGSHRDIAWALDDIAMKECVSAPQLEGPMWSFWDVLDLAIDGIHGEPEAIKEDIVKVLAKAQS